MHLPAPPQESHSGPNEPTKPRTLSVRSPLPRIPSRSLTVLAAVAALIVFLAVRLLIRWRSGFFHFHAHSHGPEDQGHRHKVRTPLGAFGIGLVHGMGGSAGVGVLLLAAIPSKPLAAASLVILAVFTAVSMTMLTTGFGATLGSAPVRRSYAVAVPALGTMSLAFGFWYAAAVWSLMPYPF